MHEVRITRYGINFATRFLELIVLICQILQFRRAHKREICGIEEEYTPLPEDIFLAYGLKTVIMIPSTLKSPISFPINDIFFLLFNLI